MVGRPGDPADWLPNPHAGDMLKLEFMDPLGMTAAQLADSIGALPAALSDVVEGRRRIDGELDLRLGRYFGMSPGFFLGLQSDHELVDAKRTLNGQLERIMPRAA
mgnify:FL=1